MTRVSRIHAVLRLTAAVWTSACTSELAPSPRAPVASGQEAPAAPATPVTQGAPIPSSDCSSAAAQGPAVDPDAVETIEPERLVPPFDVTTLDCRNLKSGELVGKRPFVLVFFSSWCKVCERKMPAVRAAAAALGHDVDFIGVALDEDETWDQVSTFVERHGLSFPIVRGAHFRTFSMGYDPFGSIPVVVVVGRDGVVVDLQVGYSPFDYNRLVGAASIAEKATRSTL